jgi:hypothetical protein
MSTSRDRTLNQDYEVTGQVLNYLISPDWEDRTKLMRHWKRNRDVIGNFPNPNDFHLTFIYTSPLLLDGEEYSGDEPTPFRGYRKCPVGYLPGPFPPGSKFPPPTLLEKQNYAWEILAETNPSLPHVSVPTAIGELKDLPSLFKDWGGDLLKKVAKGYISWRWAIKPMLRDIQRLFDFQRAVDIRLHELKRLQNEGFIRKRTGLGDSAIHIPKTTYTLIESSPGWYYGKRDALYTEKLWGTVQWNIDPAFVLPKTADGMADLANRLTFGITKWEALATAWELLPWSWLVDWFVGIGDTISANNNTLPLTHSRMCLMRTLTSESKWHSLTGGSSWITHSGEYVEKQTELFRYANITTLLPFSVTTDLPFLDKGKWSILGALAVLRRKK